MDKIERILLVVEWKEKHDTKVQSMFGMDMDNGTVKGRILRRPVPIGIEFRRFPPLFKKTGHVRAHLKK
jgi:hypothetical protein